MSEQQKKTIVVTRFDPDVDEVPKTQSYEIPVQPDWKVLDALNFIKDHVDPTLSHRWSCRMAVCGSCGMMVNGEPKLTCKTALSSYGDRVEISALANFPIVRDLVVEMWYRLGKCHSLLSRRSFRIVELVYLDGLESSEVARKLGCTPSAIDTVVHRARQLLAKHGIALRSRKRL